VNRAYLSATSKLPRYRQVLDELLGDLAGGKYKPGQKLPSEAALVQRFRTSRITIGRALRELKTRGLLPGSEDVELDEELAIWEQRDLLLTRLLECKTFKDVSAELGRLAAAAELSVPRRCGLEDQFVDLAPDLLAGITPAKLRTAFLRAVTPKPVVRIDLFHVAPVKLSVTEAVEELIDELPRVGRISFRRLTQDLVERVEVIVRFLAVLELYKQGAIELVQHGTFGSIEIEWLGAVAVSGELVDAYEG